MSADRWLPSDPVSEKEEPFGGKRLAQARLCLSCSSEVEPDEERCAPCFARVRWCKACGQRQAEESGRCLECEWEEQFENNAADYFEADREVQEMP